jgi:DNA-directed RNA polymerase specialized sigma24 family protein
MGAAAAVNSFVKQRQRDRRRSVLEASLESPSIGDGGLGILEGEQWTVQLLQHLPPAQREVMAYPFDGLSPAEIATALGKTPAAIRKNLQLARERLRRELDERTTLGPVSAATPTEKADQPQEANAEP